MTLCHRDALRASVFGDNVSLASQVWGTSLGGRAVLIAVVVAGGLLFAACGSSRRSLAPIGTQRVAVAYHVTYSVTSGRLHSSENLSVHRPFESEQVLSTGSHIVSRLGRQFIEAGGAPTVFEVAPAAAQFDQRVDAVAAAAPHGMLQVRGAKRVAGHSCRVVRTRNVLAADFDSTPTHNDHVDSCVSAAGVVLEQTTTRNGKVVSQKIARRVDFDVASSFSTRGTHVARAEGGGRIISVSDDSRPPGQDFWELTQVPAGFTHVGRFAVVAPSGPSDPVVTTIDDVYVHGADEFVVEQGGTVSGIAMAAPKGERVSLGALGTGRLTVSPAASSVAALTKNKGGFVRVTGTLRPAQLVTIARGLRSGPGGTLTTISDATSGGDA